jgi:hypothetical protein
MNIDPNQTLAGLPIGRIIAFLHEHHERRWVVDLVETAFPGCGEAILDELLEQGYVQPSSEPGIYKTTLQGDRLATARPGHRP